MPADTTDTKPREFHAADQGAAASTEIKSLLAQHIQDFDSMTVGELAQLIDEMQRMIVSIGAHLESHAQLEERRESRVGDVLDSTEIERLAAMLSAIERVRAA
jgi:hypothetical protein